MCSLNTTRRYNYNYLLGQMSLSNRERLREHLWIQSIHRSHHSRSNFNLVHFVLAFAHEPRFTDDTQKRAHPRRQRFHRAFDVPPQGAQVDTDDHRRRRFLVTHEFTTLFVGVVRA